MRIALFGPGRIGAALFPLLERDGHEVILLSRKDYGDFLSDDFAPESALDGVTCDAALILPGLFELNAAPERMLQANAKGPIRLAEALHRTQPKAHLILFLDARVHWAEAALPATIHAYMAAKCALAEWVERTAVVWGRSTGTRLNAIAPGPVLPPPHREHSEKAGECLTPRPTLADLHAAVSFLLTTPSVTGQTVFVSAGQHLLGVPLPHLPTAEPPSFSQRKRVPVALTIAGSDSGGGAGIQADLRAFRDLGVHGCNAITALTAQNPHGVSGIMPATPEILRGQLERIAEDFTVGAVKTGMLVDAPRIAVVADALPQFVCPWVIDPVMVATSGARLLDSDAVKILRERLLPKATLITPNLPEAQALLDDASPIHTLDGQISLAQRLHAMLGVAVLVKGGHAKERPSADILASASGTWLFESPTIPSPLTTHGTGCALSSAIAARLALGDALPDAIVAAKDYVLGLLSVAAPAGRAAVYAPCAPLQFGKTRTERLG